MSRLPRAAVPGLALVASLSFLGEASSSQSSYGPAEKLEPAGNPDEFPLPWDGPPNVVFILLDDLDYGDLAAYGGQNIVAPSLDALAAEGVRFTQFYANGPVCTPTRAAILTGRYPHEFGILEALPSGSRRGIPASVTTLNRVLAQAGYHTAHIGKWHLGTSKPEYLPANMGFDRVVRLLGPPGYQGFRLAFDGDPPLQIAGEAHLTEVLTNEALAFIRSRPEDRPFFLNLWHLAPHHPFEVPVDFDNAPGYDLSTEWGRFAALVTDVDEQIGRILDELESLGIADETLVLVASDNGGVATIHNMVLRPLRGFKQDVFEGGIRVPLIARWPGRIDPGTSNASVLASFDLMPTLAELAGVDVNHLHLPGRSFARLLQDGSRLPRPGPLVFETRSSNDYTPAPDGIFNTYAVREGPWKLVHLNGQSRLYRLGARFQESQDLSPERPEVLEHLEEAYDLWRREVGDVPYTVLDSGRGVARAADRLSFHGGVARLPAVPRFDFHDGDFSFATLIRPHVDLEDAVIATRAGSFRLSLEHGALRLQLLSDEGDELVLHGPGLQPNVEYHVAFTIHSWKFSDNTVRLYVDGSLVNEAVDSGIENVASNDEPILLGNDEYSLSPFFGSIELPRISTNGMHESEVFAEARRARLHPRPFSLNPSHAQGF